MSNYKWQENICCISVYNILENDNLMDQFEKEEVSFQDAKTLNEPTAIDSKYTEGNLISKLKDNYELVIEDHISASTYKKIHELDSFSDDNDILKALENIDNTNVQDLLFDVFLYLKEDDVDGAKNRILLFSESIRKVSEAWDGNRG